MVNTESADGQPPLVDAHCHLDLYPDPAATVAAAQSKGISAIITAGIDMESSGKISALTGIEGVYGVIGVHPDATPDEGFSERLAEIAKSNKRIIGIGETGLDAKVADRISLEAQARVFSEQLDLALKLRVPVVIHARGTLPQVVQMLDDKAIEKAMFHFFSGNEVDALALEKKGYLISIPPIESSRLKRVIKSVELGTLVTETDGPMVGKEPSDVKATVEKIAQFKGIAFEDACAGITETLKDYFGIIQ